MPLTVELAGFRTMNEPFSGELHVRAAASRARPGGSPRRTSRKPREQKAPSDDSSGSSVVGDAPPDRARSADRELYAAGAHGDGEGPTRVPKKGVEQWKPKLAYPDAELQPIEVLPRDGVRFVEAVNEEVQLVGVAKELLCSQDVKIQQRVFEQLVEIAYGKNVRAEEAQPRKLSWNVPR